MFTEAYPRFFRDLAQHNNREWFLANKSRYENEVKAPFTRFVQQMIDRIQERDARVVITPKDAIFRIYRDVRFSKDKTPYKVKMSAVISKGGRKDLSHPGIYFELSEKEARVYSGAYSPDKKQLAGIRERIAADPSAFRAIIEEDRFVKTFGEIQGEKNKRLPTELREAAEKEPLIYHKSFYVYTSFAPSVYLKENMVEQFMECYEVALPFSKFLSRAMTA